MINALRLLMLNIFVNADLLDNIKGGMHNIAHFTYQLAHPSHWGAMIGQFGGWLNDSVIKPVASTLLRPVASLISNLFWSSAIGKWLESHSAAATIFCVDYSNNNNINSTKTLQDIIDHNPLGLIFPAGHEQLLVMAINDLQVLFNTLMIAILIFAVMMIGSKLSASGMLNSQEMRTKAMNMAIRVGVVFIILEFLPQIIGLALKINGVIVEFFQQTMMSIHMNIPNASKVFGTKMYKNVYHNQVPNIWMIACQMGADSETLNNVLSSFGGFIFNLIYVLICLGTAMWVKFYYIWREFSFVILYLMAYIQIPAFAFVYTRNHFFKWCKDMFGVIFIQSVHAFVITLMAGFYSLCLVTLGQTNTSLVKDFGTMFMMAIILTMFQPLTKVIANHLDMNSSMIDDLHSTGSSAAHNIASAYGSILGAAVTATTGIALGSGAKVASGLNKLHNSGIEVMKASRKKQEADWDGSEAAKALAMRRQDAAKAEMKNAAKQTAKGAKDLAGTLGHLAEKINEAGMISLGYSNNNNNTKQPHPLKTLYDTVAGGVIGNKTAKKYQGDPQNLGIKNYSDIERAKEQQAEASDEAEQEQAIKADMTGNNDAAAKSMNRTMQSDVGIKTASSQATANAKTAIQKQTGIKPPRDNNTSISNMESYADQVANSSLASRLHAHPSKEALANLHKNNSNNNSDYLDNYSQYINSPTAIKKAMNDAIKSTSNVPNNQNIKDTMMNGSVPVQATMNAFERNLQNLGYSANDAHSIAYAADGVQTAPKAGNININDNPVNNDETSVPHANAVSANTVQQNAFTTTHPATDIGNADPSQVAEGILSSNGGTNNMSQYYIKPSTSMPSAGEVITPSYLSSHIARDNNNAVEPGTLIAHVTNGSSYISAKMNDGSEQIVSHLNQGDPRLSANQEFQQPLTLHNNVVQPWGTNGHSNAGWMVTNGESVPYRADNNAAVAQLVNAYNGGHANRMITSASAANNLVDKGNYTLEHLAIEPNLSDFRLDANSDASYITAYDRNHNHRVRISPRMAGIDDLSPQMNMSMPLSFDENNYQMSFVKENDGFIFDSTDGSMATSNDFSVTDKWIRNVHLSDYIAATKTNASNYIKNHAGNLDINQLDFNSEI